MLSSRTLLYQTFCHKLSRSSLEMFNQHMKRQIDIKRCKFIIFITTSRFKFSLIPLLLIVFEKVRESIYQV